MQPTPWPWCSQSTFRWPMHSSVLPRLIWALYWQQTEDFQTNMDDFLLLVPRLGAPDALGGVCRSDADKMARAFHQYFNVLPANRAEWLL